LLLSVLVLLLRRYRSPRHRARRGLDRLRSSAAHSHLDNRTAAHALAALLRQGLAGHRRPGLFTPVTGAPAVDAQRWADFSRQLAEARFAPQPCSPQQLRALLEEAGALLETRP
jgi:DNA-binding LacI/PurR family transcriptional regulator